MGQRFGEIGEQHRAFIERQRMFFVGTAAPEGRVNVSPKGMDTLRVLGPNRVVWLNLTGSGNETAAHLRECERMTLMWCSFEGPPLILRLYGTARAVHGWDADWDELMALFPGMPGPRQVLDMHVDLVQTSCGAGVPLYAYVGDRDDLRDWLAGEGDEGIRQYWAEANQVSLDGKPTGVLGEG